MKLEDLPTLLAMLSKANVSAFKGFGVELVIGPGPVEVPTEKVAEPAAEQPVAKAAVAAPVTKQVNKGAGLLASARKASAPMATPAVAPAQPEREPVEQAPLVRSEVASSGRHAGSTAAVNVATSPAGRP